MNSAIDSMKMHVAGDMQGHFEMLLREKANRYISELNTCLGLLRRYHYITRK